MKKQSREELAGYFNSLALLAQEAADKIADDAANFFRVSNRHKEDSEFFRDEYLEYIQGDLRNIERLLGEGE